MTPSSTPVATGGTAYEQLLGRWSRLLAPAEPFLDFVGTAPGERVLGVRRGPVADLHRPFASRPARPQVQLARIFHATA
jgi:hypothetical protein